MFMVIWKEGISMKKTIAIMLVLSAMLLSGCQSGGEPKVTEPIPPRDPAYNVGEIRIGDRSIAQYKVVLAEDASESERFAAQELVDYIALATGRTLETAESAEYAIRIGGNTDETLGEEGFEIRVEGEDLVIAGGKTRGTLYGVYTFLEDYVGWRWYDYDCEAVKVSDFIQIPSDLRDRQTPVYWLRNSFWYNFLQHHEFAVKHKSNQGITEAEYGGGVDYTGGLCHTFAQIVPIEIYFDEHPEYYSYKGGVYKGGQYEGQLCLTNPEVLEIAKAYVRNLLAETPNARLISVTQNDNQTCCGCDACMAVAKEEGSQAGLMLRFVNAIADDIAEDYPNVTIDTFAYQYTRKPPEITRPAKNVQVRLCSIECCFAHPLEDPDCKKNVKFMEDLRGWAAICNNLHVWDYTTNFTDYSTPFPNLGVIRQNAKTFADNHVTGLFEQGAYNNQNGEFGELKAYLLAKLLWNPYMSEEEYNAHIDDFLEGYYGAGWKGIRQYLDLMLKGVEKDRHATIFGAPGYYNITDKEIEQIKQWWDEARAAATPEQLVRLDRSYLSVLITERTYYAFYAGADHREYNARARELLREIEQWRTEHEIGRGEH